MKSIQKYICIFISFVLLYTLYNFHAEIFFQHEVAILCARFILPSDSGTLKSRSKFLGVKSDSLKNLPTLRLDLRRP